MFNQVCSFENLLSAHLKARKGRRYWKYILDFDYNAEKNLLDLRKELWNQTYQHGRYKEFIVNDSKKREIKAAPFRDRVVHHALCNIIEPILDKKFIFDSYACREGKGVHRAVKRLQQFIRAYSPNNFYILKCDVKKYFDSIDHQKLQKLIKKKIKDTKVLWLIEVIIESQKGEKGIPLGNLTSQLFANIYLNELDQFIKHKLREKHYVRYMDDFLILSYDKKYLHSIKEEIRCFLIKELKLELHLAKTNVFPIKQGINFLGYRVFPAYRLLKKSTVKRFSKRMKVYRRKMKQGLMSKAKFRNSFCSWMSYAEFANSWHLQKKYISAFVD